MKRNCGKRTIKSAVDGGWEVKSSEVPEALDMFVEYFGEETAVDEIARSMGTDTLNDNLDWVIRHWGFAEDVGDMDDSWDKYEYAKEVMGVHELFENLTEAAGYDELAEDLAFIFRQYDFREWDERNEIESSRKTVKSAKKKAWKHPDEVAKDEGADITCSKQIKSSIDVEQVDDFPEYMVTYAYYGDMDGVTDEDIDAYEKWRKRNGFGSLLGIDTDMESHFSSHPAFGLACNVVSATFSVDKSIHNSCKQIRSSQSAASLKGWLDDNFWTQYEDFESEIEEAGWNVEIINDEYAVISDDNGSQYKVYFNSRDNGEDLTMKSFNLLRTNKNNGIKSGYYSGSRKQVKSGRYDEVDPHAVEDLYLTTINDGEIYHRFIMPTIENLRKHHRRGQYDRNKAMISWMRVADEGAKQYDRDFGSGRGSVTMFSPATRKKVAEKMASYYEENVMEGAVESSRKIGSSTYKVFPTENEDTYQYYPFNNDIEADEFCKQNGYTHYEKVNDRSFEDDFDNIIREF